MLEQDLLLFIFKHATHALQTQSLAMLHVSKLLRDAMQSASFWFCNTYSGLKTVPFKCHAWFPGKDLFMYL